MSKTLQYAIGAPRGETTPARRLAAHCKTSSSLTKTPISNTVAELSITNTSKSRSLFLTTMRSVARSWVLPSTLQEKWAPWHMKVQ